MFGRHEDGLVEKRLEGDGLLRTRCIGEPSEGVRRFSKSSSEWNSFPLVEHVGTQDGNHKGKRQKRERKVSYELWEFYTR